MALMAQALGVALLIEATLSQRGDVIALGCQSHQAVALALGAQWVSLE
jgi:hypothetical protein